MAYEECTVVGRNAVMEAYRSGKTIDKLFILDGCQDGPIKSILREARKRDTLIKFVSKEKLDSLSFHEKHQGVVAIAAAYEYATVEDLFKKAEEKGEAPFFILCDEIEDPHNLGAIIRTANLAGAHGVIIPKRRAVGLTSTVAKVSAGVKELAEWNEIGVRQSNALNKMAADEAAYRSKMQQLNSAKSRLDKEIEKLLTGR